MAVGGHLFFLLVSFGFVTSVERGFVYCPAYPCKCESVDGALVINCRHLYLLSLPKFLSFEGRIKELSLRYNNIRHLPANGFQGLHIEDLDLLDNAVTSVDQDAFTGLENSLRSLSLQVYAMYGLPTMTLSRLSSLQSLSIIGCNQREILPDLFQNLSALEELHLIGCRIARIQPGALSPMFHLKTLVLSQNALESQHHAEISQLKNLMTLDLSSNNIQSLSSLMFPSFSKLKSLNVASNNLTWIAKETFYNLDFSLEELDLRDNHIVDEVLGSLANLRLLLRLDISDNNIYNLSGEYFSGMRYLQILKVANNKVKSIGRHSFYGLGPSLLELDLHGNPLDLIKPGTFVDFRVLEKLNLRHTKLGRTFGPYTFTGLSHSLKYLDISMSELITDDLQAFSCLTNITDLDVSSNNICSIDMTVLTIWSQLTRANFSNNNVSTFVTGHLSVSGSSLETLDLSGNNIQAIHECGFFVFRNLRDVYLHGNPLACNCSSSWLYRWLQIRHVSPDQSTHRWTCSSPAFLQDSYFSDLEFSDLKCPPSLDQEDQCFKLYDTPLPHDILFETRIVSLNSTPPCESLCLNISRPDTNYVYVEWLAKKLQWGLCV
ncbi:unnamed protein product [Candidula unifasciata]|uniref:LRRCT domain-containing protein n=1 Tax=Candidula unifasciata TaxID=100452 RepID=A0A8S3Z3X0_9EUPU|nr:unnamed protein product [Candidula unifasciata]